MNFDHPQIEHGGLGPGREVPPYRNGHRVLAIVAVTVAALAVLFGC